MIIVELKPGVATGGLAERSAAEMAEDERRKAEEEARRATERQRAIDAVSRTRIAWVSSMNGVKAAAMDAKVCFGGSNPRLAAHR